MDSTSKFNQAAVDCGLDPIVLDALQARGYNTPAELHFSFLNSWDAELIIWEILVNQGVAQDLDDSNYSSSPKAGRFRRFMQACSTIVKEAQPSSSSGLSGLGQSHGNAEQAPRKIDKDKIKEQKELFLKSYPGEILTPDNTPGPSYRSKVLEMGRGDKEFYHIPLRKILSAKEEEDIRDSKGLPKDALAFLVSSLDDPEKPGNEGGSMGLNAYRNIQEVRRNCFALNKHCHMALWKLLDLRILNCYNKKYTDLSEKRIAHSD